MRTNKQLLQSLMLAILLLGGSVNAATLDSFSFGVIGRPSASGAEIRAAISDTDEENLAFVVANGVKAAKEPCTDAIYAERKKLLATAKHALILSLAATDWAECPAKTMKTTAIGRLTHLRELFFHEEFSMGAAKLPLNRQSSVLKFRSFAENARWEVGKVMFATINLPRNNNHYLFAAGRNSEFEDRLVANRDWLRRVFSYATRRDMDAVVLFADGNPLRRDAGVRRDGFSETRQLIASLSRAFPGKVLLVHGSTGPRTPHDIQWQGKLGSLGVEATWIRVDVDTSKPMPFDVISEEKPPPPKRERP